MRAERNLGRLPEVLAHNNPEYDVRSRDAAGRLVHIEVKGRDPGGEDFFVTNREIRVRRNADNYRAGAGVGRPRRSGDEVRYLHRPFADERVPALASRVQFKWNDIWERGGPPS